MKKYFYFVFVLSWIFSGVLSSNAAGEVPRLINFQGRITDTSGNLFNAQTEVTFSIYTQSSGGRAVWTETQTVTVTDGLFNALLGAVNPLDPDDFSRYSPTYLGVTVGSDDEMSPRNEIVSVAYSMKTEGVNVKDGKVGIGTADPRHELEVDGWIGMEGRRGYHTSGTVPGDGNWHSILSDLTGHNGYEVIADISKGGCHGLTHAICMKTYMGDGATGGLTKTQTYYGSTNCRIDIQWSGSTYDYDLQIRTLQDYGTGYNITYYVTKLW